MLLYSDSVMFFLIILIHRINHIIIVITRDLSLLCIIYILNIIYLSCFYNFSCRTAKHTQSHTTDTEAHMQKEWWTSSKTLICAIYMVWRTGRSSQSIYRWGFWERCDILKPEIYYFFPCSLHPGCVLDRLSVELGQASSIRGGVIGGEPG